MHPRSFRYSACTLQPVQRICFLPTDELILPYDLAQLPFLRVHDPPRTIPPIDYLIPDLKRNSFGHFSLACLKRVGK